MTVQPAPTTLQGPESQLHSINPFLSIRMGLHPCFLSHNLQPFLDDAPNGNKPNDLNVFPHLQISVFINTQRRPIHRNIFQITISTPLWQSLSKRLAYQRKALHLKLVKLLRKLTHWRTYFYGAPTYNPLPFKSVENCCKFRDLSS